MIAEGVEDELTLKRLELLGCDLAQGNHLGRPVAADEFAERIGLGDAHAHEMSREPLEQVQAG